MALLSYKPLFDHKCYKSFYWDIIWSVLYSLEIVERALGIIKYGKFNYIRHVIVWFSTYFHCEWLIHFAIKINWCPVYQSNNIGEWIYWRLDELSLRNRISFSDFSQSFLLAQAICDLCNQLWTPSLPPRFHVFAVCNMAANNTLNKRVACVTSKLEFR